jgi:hypothetical protein
VWVLGKYCFVKMLSSAFFRTVILWWAGDGIMADALFGERNMERGEFEKGEM